VICTRRASLSAQASRAKTRAMVPAVLGTHLDTATSDSHARATRIHGREYARSLTSSASAGASTALGRCRGSRRPTPTHPL
jgi:hypothetical protein